MRFETLPLGSLCDRVTSGGTPKSTKAEYYGGNIPWLNTKEINFNRIYSTERYISQLGFESSSAKWISTPAVIIAMYGATAGKAAISLIPLTTNQACCNLEINGSKADYRYIYYYLKWKYKELSSLANGGAQQNLSVQLIKNFPVLLPNLISQKTIADLLWSIDDKIELNQRIIDNLQQQAQALFSAWFMDFEPFREVGWHNSGLGLIPQGWKVAKLVDVTTNIRTKVKDRPCKVLSAVNTGTLQLSEEYFSKQVFSKNISNYIIVEENDFAYNPARVNIGSIGMNDLGILGCVSPVYVVVRTQPGYHYFFNFFIKSERFKEEVRIRASGSVRQSMNYTDFGVIEIVYPPYEIVEKFNQLYTPILNNIRQREAENKKLAEIRDALLPKLMAGEIEIISA